jgi:hypothetical protein
MAMKLGSITLLLNDDVVAGGFSFRLIFNWWEISVFLILVACLFYFIRRKRKNKS